MGAAVNAPNDLGYTALHLAIQEGHTDIARLLIEKGADLNVKHSNGWTALHFAVQKGHKEIVVLLLSSGAYKADKNDINARNCIGETALHVAARLGREEIGDEIINLLIARGADVNAKDDIGYTAVKLAAENAHNAIIWETNFKNKNPYLTGYLPIVKSLVIAGADLEYKQYDTDINEAIEEGKSELISVYDSQRNHLSELQKTKAENYLEENKVPVAKLLTPVEAIPIPMDVDLGSIQVVLARWLH